MITTVLLDFDGTLVDTAPGILAGFRTVLGEAGVAAVQPIDTRVIGPPLRTTLTRLTGIDDADRIERLARAFIATYDVAGILQAEPYPGVADVLAGLTAEGRACIVVTNKRRAPARMITERLGLAMHLAGLYSLDTLTPPAVKKAAVIAHVLAERRVAMAAAIMVGDSVEDAEAAEANGIGFIAATYGYGSPLAFTGAAPVATLAQPTDLPGLLRGLA